jgi:hypothetical protein
MFTEADSSSRTERLLTLMTKGDDLFNARDWDALEPVHHPAWSRMSPGPPTRSTEGPPTAKR